MHVFQTAAYVARRSIATASGVAWEPRVLLIRLMNGTGENVEVVNGPLMSSGTCAVSFTTLRPGEAGTIRFTSRGSLMDNAMSGCHHSGAIELSLGEERLFIAESNPIGQSISRRSRFAFGFADAEGGAEDLDEFYRALPAEFMGTPGARSSAKGQELLARASASSHYEVDLTLLGEELSELEHFDTLQHLAFAQTCQERAPELLIHSLFVAEVSAVISALSPVRLIDKVFVLDLLIFTFILSGLLDPPGTALHMNLGLWQRNWCLLQPMTQEVPDYSAYLAIEAPHEGLRAHVEAALLLLRAASFRAMAVLHEVMVKFKALGAPRPERSFESNMAQLNGRRQSVLASPSNDDIMREHLGPDVGRPIRSGYASSSTSSSSSTPSFSSEASEPSGGAETPRMPGIGGTLFCMSTSRWYCAPPPRRRRLRASATAVAAAKGLETPGVAPQPMSLAVGSGASEPGAALAAEGPVASRRRPRRRGGVSDPSRRNGSKRRDGGLARLVACASCSAGEPTVGEPTRRPEELLKMLVRHCIHTSSDYALCRAALFEAVLAQLGGAQQRCAALRRYIALLPLAQRCFATDKGCGLPGVRFRSYSSELFGNLDQGTLTGPSQVLASLGYASVEYKEITTNSKSGEFFFISDDKRFLIKTISESECGLLQRMLTEYQDHIRRCPRSLIVRYAGLFHVEVPEARLSQYFTVMRSVFSRQHEIQETFDLKGSLFNRKRKTGESIGKDEDWLVSGTRLDVPAAVRRELCATHELDIDLLRRFDVMDYSLLVGLHFAADGVVAKESETCGLSWNFGGGIISEDHRTIYFIGLIDFLINYDLRKEGEHLIRVAQGHGEDASCVSPQDYAERQIKFLWDCIMPEGMEAVGSLGCLRIEVRSAQDLIAGDWLGTSDPYVQVSLGLLRRRTHTVERDCSPRWRCTLLLPVNRQHAAQDLEISVWDEDQNRALRGADDFLGRVVLRMEHLLAGPHELRGHPLADVKRGRLWARLSFEPVRQ